MAVTIETFIAAPRERVFALFTDLEGAASRLSGVRSIEILTEGPIGPGTRWRETRLMFGQPSIQEMQVVSADPPNGFVVAAQNISASFETRFSFHDHGGGTKVVCSFNAEPRNPMMKIFLPFTGFIEGAIQGVLQQDMADIKRLAER